MYSLDVNFLNDRDERLADVGGRSPTVRAAPESNRPLILGLIVGALLPGIVGGLWFFLQTQNGSLRSRQQELNAELATLQAALQEVATVEEEVAAINRQNQALAGVFDRVKPWSAVIQDLRSRVPVGLKISQIQEVQSQQQPTAVEDPALATPEPPLPTIQISGVSQSFDDVNDLVNLMRDSPFWNPETVRIVTAQLISNPAQVDFEGEQQPPGLEVRLPDVVEYSVSGELTRQPSSTLLQDMRNTLSVGLPARIDALRDLGVVQP